MKSPKNHVILCCFLVCTSLFYTQVYFTSLPHIAYSLSSSPSSIQLAFTINILGFGFSQILYGPCSDLCGRKNILLTGLLFALLGNTLCAVSTNSLMLCVGQLIAGIGAGACSIIPRTITKDIFSGAQLLKAITCMSIASTVTTGTAPIIGGLLQSLFGWRSIFIFLTTLTIIALLLIFHFLSETIKEKARSFSIQQITEIYARILIDRKFLIYATLNSIAYSSIIIYLIISPFLFQKIFSYSENQNSLIYLLCAICYLTSNLILPYLNKIIYSQNIIGLGIVFIVIGNFSIMIPFSPQYLTSIKLVICGILIHFGSGLITPITYKKILDNLKFPAGITAGAINSMRVFVAFTVSIFATTLTTSNTSSLTYILGVLSLTSIAIYYVLTNKKLEEHVSS